MCFVNLSVFGLILCILHTGGLWSREYLTFAANALHPSPHNEVWFSGICLETRCSTLRACCIYKLDVVATIDIVHSTTLAC